MNGVLIHFSDFSYIIDMIRIPFLYLTFCARPGLLRELVTVRGDWVQSHFFRVNFKGMSISSLLIEESLQIMYQWNLELFSSNSM